MDFELCTCCCLVIVLIVVCSFAINMHLNQKCNNNSYLNKVEFGLFVAGCLIPAVIIFCLIVGCLFGYTEEMLAMGRGQFIGLICFICVVGALSGIAWNMHNTMKCSSDDKPKTEGSSDNDFIIFIVGLVISVLALIFILYKMSHHDNYKHHFSNVSRLIKGRRD